MFYIELHYNNLKKCKSVILRYTIIHEIIACMYVFSLRNLKTTICCNQLIGLVGRVFVNVPGDLCSKMVPDNSLLNSQRYKVIIKGKVIVGPLQHLGVVAIENGAFWSPSTTVTYFTLLLYFYNFRIIIMSRWYSLATPPYRSSH